MVYKRIRDLREDKDMTQRQIASVLNSYNRFIAIMSSGREIFQKTLIKLCKFYRVSADYILGISDNLKTIK